MKKFLYLTMALPLLAATSCSNDDLPASGQDDGMTTFTVKMPGEIPSRVFADGTTAKNLAVAVYDENDNLLYSNIAGQGEALPEGASVGDFSAGLTTTVTLPLVKDKEYNVAFWAYAENSPYTFSPGDKKITVNYTGALANDDTRDGFFNYYNVPAQRPATKNVELRRPFAQINIGTSDLEVARKAGVTVTSANISFPAGALATAYNFVEGTADTPNTAAVTFTGSALPADAFPVQPETYKYLVMAYVLTPVDQTSQPKTVMQSVSLAVNGNAFASYDNIPAQANYQTNIYGALLTKKENFNVTINPAFFGSYMEEQPVQTIASSDPTEVTAALEKGGNFELTGNIEALDLSGLSRTKPVKVTVKGTVGTLNPGTKAENPSDLIINVPKGVAYPQFIANGKSDWKNITIQGDLSSSQRCQGLVFSNSGLKELSDITLDGVPFEGQGLNFGYTANPQVVRNIKVVGCDFADMKQPCVNGGSNMYAGSVQGDIEIRNNHIVYASDAAENTNGIYLTQSTGNILIDSNVIEDAPYHGIYISSAANSATTPGIMPADALKNADIVVTNNSIVTPKHDGVKMDSPYGNVLIQGNTVDNAGENGIRVCRFNSSWTPTVAVEDNTISIKVGLFFYGILFTELNDYTGTAVINVLDNVGLDKKSKTFSLGSGFKPAAGSNYSQPFAN